MCINPIRVPHSRSPAANKLKKGTCNFPPLNLWDETLITSHRLLANAVKFLRTGVENIAPSLVLFSNAAGHSDVDLVTISGALYLLSANQESCQPCAVFLSSSFSSFSGFAPPEVLALMLDQVSDEVSLNFCHHERFNLLLSSR